MAESKWEKYVVRRPMRYVIDEATKRPVREEVPKSLPVPKWAPQDTGVQIAMSPLLIPEAYSIVEYGIISGDIEIGTKGQTVQPHKHLNYEEMFLFIGTDPDNVSDLGGEIEFWIGEGPDLEKIVFTEPGCIYVPKGTGHFPQIFRKVRRPIVLVVIMPKIAEREMIPIDTRGRPSFD